MNNLHLFTTLAITEGSSSLNAAFHTSFSRARAFYAPFSVSYSMLVATWIRRQLEYRIRFARASESYGNNMRYPQDESRSPIPFQEW